MYKTSFTNVDFPEPDTPVTQLNTPNGNFTLTFFKLFSVAPCTSITFDFTAFLLFLGTGIFNLPLKYFPVIDFSTFFISSAVPCAELHSQRFIYQHDRNELIERLTDFSRADDEPDRSEERRVGKECGS